MCNATKLHTFEFGKPCGLLVDASNIAVVCCLIQWTAFASCKLTATQSAMSTIEREAFAVIYALRKFRNFVFFFKQKTAYEIGVRLVGSEMCIRDRHQHAFDLLKQSLCNATKLHTFEFGKPCG